MIIKYKVSDLAKDMGLSNKDVLTVVNSFGGEEKKHASQLTEEELDFFFNSVTKEHQVSSLEAYFVNVPEAKKPEPKKEPEKPQQQKPQQKQNKQQGQNQGKDQGQQQNQNNKQQYQEYHSRSSHCHHLFSPHIRHRWAKRSPERPAPYSVY